MKATLGEYGRAVLIVYEAMERAQHVCPWASRDSLYEASEHLHDRKVVVLPAKSVPQ
jgi:hypothetical protein